MKKQMSGIEYEEYCTEYLYTKGFRHIGITKASGDQGIDIIARKNGKKYGIQCKYYDTPVGNASVQQAYAGAAYYGCDVALVMTNTEFTRGAIELAEQTDVVLWSNISEDHTSLSIPFTITMRFFFLIAGIILFIQLSKNAFETCRSIYALLSCGTILASLTGIFSFDHIITTVFTLLFDLATLLVWFFLLAIRKCTVSFPWWTLQLLVSTLTLLRLLRLLIRQKRLFLEKEEEELKELIEEETEREAIRLKGILEKKLNCNCELLDHVQNGTITSFTFHTDRTVPHLLKDAENTLNRSEEAEERNVAYVITDMQRRRINVTMSERQISEKEI